MFVDAHQHFWKLDLPFDYRWLRETQHTPICRDYLPSDLKPLLQNSGVSRSVFVQTQHLPDETRWALKLAEENEFLAGVVGWVDLASESCESQLDEFRSCPKFVGVRHITQSEPDDNFILQPEILRGLRVLQKYGVPFDLLFYPRHLRHAVTLARALPDLPMVIDHLSKPFIRDQAIDGWKADLQEAAKAPNVFCKLSGLVTEADWKNWKPADLKPYIETALEAFGAERCMFGSDWPVCELAAPYERVFNALTELTDSLSAAEKNLIFGGTACRFYGLKEH